MINLSIILITIAVGLFIASILQPGPSSEPLVFSGYVFMVLALAAVYGSGKYRQ